MKQVLEENEVHLATKFSLLLQSTAMQGIESL